MASSKITAECPKDTIGKYFCPNCNNQTEQNILALVKRYDEELFNDVQVQFWNDYYTTQCRGCKTISFCKTSMCSEEFDFDAQGTPIFNQHKETYPLIEESKEVNNNLFVNFNRINEIQSISNDAHDTSKLYQILIELNHSYNSKSYLSCIFLVRSIIDHVPPIFGKNNFNEVANNYTASGMSFKDAMLHLQNSSRKIADIHLHSQIKKSEILPSETQIEFRADLDLLLVEIIHILTK